MYEILNFNDLEDFCNNIVHEELNKKNNYEYWGIVAKYEQARDIIENLMIFGYKLGLVNLNFEYFNEYEVTILDDVIMCEPLLKKDNGYILSGATVVYTMGDVNSKCIKESYSDANKIYIIELDSDKDEDSDNTEENTEDNEWNDHLIKDVDGKIHGFTVSSSDDEKYKSLSFYITDEIGDSIEKFCKNLKGFLLL